MPINPVLKTVLFPFSLTLSLLFAATVSAQPEPPAYKVDFDWPKGKTAAISLSFDDARPSQLDNGVPILNSYNAKATFYVSPFAIPGHEERWKAAAKKGHELGNHASNHPCSGNFAWTRDYGLEVENFTLKELREDITNAQAFLKKHLGVSPRSFAYPCGNTQVGRGENTRSYVPLITELFDNGRLWRSEYQNDPAFVDRYQLSAIRMDEVTFEELLPIIQKAQKEKRWVIFAGHDVGIGGPYSVRPDTLKALIEYAQDPKNKLWLDTITNIADYIKAHRNPKTEKSKPRRDFSYY